MPVFAVVFGVSLYSVLGMIWIKGVDYVKANSPKYLPSFYMILAVIRMVSILTVIGLYLLFISKSQEESVTFVIMMLSMYALMMMVTLLIRH